MIAYASTPLDESLVKVWLSNQREETGREKRTKIRASCSLPAFSRPFSFAWVQQLCFGFTQ